MNTSTIKSLQATIKNNSVVLRLRMKNGVEKFMEMPGHSMHSASATAETMKRDAARFNDENMIISQFN